MYQAIDDALQALSAAHLTVWMVVSPFAYWIWNKLNSNFSAALWGALIGALAARYIARNAEHRQRLRDEISGVNNAVALAANITNTFITMKCRHTLGMSSTYKRTFDEYVTVLCAPPPPPLHFEYVEDLRVLQMPLTCIVELRQTILEKVKSSVEAINISVRLHQSIDSLSVVLERQPQIIEQLRAIPQASDRLIRYFGLKTPQGHIDTSFSDNVSAIFFFVDDGIYFSMLLCEVLTAHGRVLAKEYGKNPPKVKAIVNPEFEDPEILPDKAYFLDFERIFRTPSPPEKPRTFRQRAAARWNAFRLW
jgi:hypothetical protein